MPVMSVMYAADLAKVYCALIAKVRLLRFC